MVCRQGPRASILLCQADHRWDASKGHGKICSAQSATTATETQQKGMSDASAFHVFLFFHVDCRSLFPNNVETQEPVLSEGQSGMVLELRSYK